MLRIIKRIGIWIVIGMLPMVLLILVQVKNSIQLEMELQDGVPVASMNNDEEFIKGWEKEGVFYFFIPSYMKPIKLTDTNGKVLLSKIPWMETATVSVSNGGKEAEWSGQVCFYHSDNLPVIFFEMPEESAKTLFEDKEQKFPAQLKLRDEKGDLVYNQNISYITGRGNSTWTWDKKPFTFRLSNAEPLLGMDSGTGWVLLANAYEGTKLMYKMTLDAAREMGLNYTSDSRWVDVYINGEYQGNYLLAEKLEVARGRVEISDLQHDNKDVNDGSYGDPYVEGWTKGFENSENPENITGGYLLEKDVGGYYGAESCGVITPRGYAFSVKSPSNGSRAEMEYICHYIQTVDGWMSERNPLVLQFIDRDSFYKKYLLDEMALNSDANCTSAFFYKEKDRDILYAGPAWDYDGAYGESGEIWMDPSQSVLDINALRGTENFALEWYRELLEIPGCQEEMQELYRKYRSIYVRWLKKDIDRNVKKIAASVQMDMKRWDYGKDAAGYYYDYENSIRYYKYFVSSRIQWMDEQFGISGGIPEQEKRSELHTVTLKSGNTCTDFQVKDGDCLNMETLPDYGEEGVEYRYERDGKEVSPFLPVYEDTVIFRE